jgi:hypothetical protein
MFFLTRSERRRSLESLHETETGLTDVVKNALPKAVAHCAFAGTRFREIAPSRTEPW